LTISRRSLYPQSVKRLYTSLNQLGVPVALVAVALVWIGAHFTWLTLHLYPVVMSSLATAAIALAAALFARWQNGPREKTSRLWIAFGLTLSGVALTVTVNFSVTALAIVAIGAIILIARFLPEPGLPRTVALAPLAAMPIITGAAAVDPILARELPQVIVAAAITMLFALVIGLTDLARIPTLRRPELPQSACLMAAIAVWSVLVLTMIVSVSFGWYGTLFRDLAVYALGLPVMGLLILIWGNPSDTMLRIGRITLRAGSLLALAALATA
jgi:hypothetical protein